jgi:hypothetical protein
MALEEPSVQRLILGLQNGLNWSASWNEEFRYFCVQTWRGLYSGQDL